MRDSFLRSTLARAAVLALLLASAACYHSIVKTNLQPGTEAHHIAFATSWINGLVPARVDAGQYCPGKRWAMVETQTSFVNGLVRVLTLGIYSPMDIRITCAAT